MRCHVTGQRLVGTLVVLLLGLVQVQGQLETQPQQVHIAYGDDPTQMSVTWVTFSPAPVSVVEYGLNDLQMYAKGSQTTFTDGGSLHRKIYIHRVILKDLIPGQRYLYHCGGPAGWSDVFYMKAMPAGNNWTVRMAVYGDLGNVNPQSLARLQEETQKGMLDAILHVGDFAYNMDTDNATVGDSFMRQIESVAAYLPYMTCVGNHEGAYNFSNYKARFTMPKAGGDGENIFFSFNIGPAHIIAFSTEVLFFTNYGKDIIANQLAWLKKDLSIANLPANRAERPWIITMGHRPMYCSNNDRDDCTRNTSIVRDHLEELFYQQGVDLTLWAHEHSYERLFPLYNQTMCNGSDSAPYTNPEGPVHITTGSGGCQEHHDGFLPVRPAYSAFRAEDYGYSRMTIVNSTHLQLDQVSDDKNGAIIDSMTLIKDKHGAGLYTCHKRPPPQESKAELKVGETEKLTFKEKMEIKEDISIDDGEFHKREHLTFNSMREWQETMEEGAGNRL